MTTISTILLILASTSHQRVLSRLLPSVNPEDVCSEDTLISSPFGDDGFPHSSFHRLVLPACVMQPAQPTRRITPTLIRPADDSLWPHTIPRIYHVVVSNGITLEPTNGVHWCGLHNGCIPGICSPSASSAFCTGATDQCPGPRCALGDLHLRANHLGLGVYGAKDFTPGEFIGEYAGLLTSHPTPGSGYIMAISRTASDGQRLFIDARTHGNVMRFVNHSCEPNASFFEISDPFRVAVVAFALEHIPAGSEITVDYGDHLWFDCRCGTTSCRHAA